MFHKRLLHRKRGFLPRLLSQRSRPSPLSSAHNGDYRSARRSRQCRKRRKHRLRHKPMVEESSKPWWYHNEVCTWGVREQNLEEWNKTHDAGGQVHVCVLVGYCRYRQHGHDATRKMKSNCTPSCMDRTQSPFSSVLGQPLGNTAAMISMQ
jgi:hypothetical protein